MPYADLDDIRLFYTDDGAGDPPLLLIHGWGSDSQEWCWHLTDLADRHRVIAVDLRGHGHSSIADQGNTPRQMADDLARLCDHLNLSRVIPIGHSMGGLIVSILAVERPELVEALVTVDPGYGYGPEVGFGDMIEALKGEDAHAVALQIDTWDYTAASPAWLKPMHDRRLLATPPHVLAQAFEGMFAPNALGLRHNAEDYLRRRDCPQLTFWFNPAMADWEAGLFKHPKSKAVAWPGSGHRLHEERPREFLLVVNEWIAEVVK